jgi:Uma2 family endonuclease
MTTYPLRTRRWTRVEYERLIDIGFLHEDEPVELLAGHMIEAEPKGSRHATAVCLIADELRAACGRGWVVRVQDPVALDDESEPEPDVVVVPGHPRDYLDAHPARPVLVVEVAESSLAFDRHHKSGLYARAGIADYWIVNVVADVLEVHRAPVADTAAEFGWRYGNIETFGSGTSISPLCRPDVILAVADLLP